MTRRLVLAALAFAATEVFLVAAHNPLHPLQIGLLALLVGLVAGIMSDLDSRRFPWPRPAVESTRSGVERRMAAYTRMIENNQSANIPDVALRDVLRRLADLRLQTRGLTYDAPEARPLLGERLQATLMGPPRRLRTGEISAHLDRIEAL